MNNIKVVEDGKKILMFLKRSGENAIVSYPVSKEDDSFQRP